MVIVPRTEQVSEPVCVKRLVHRYGKYILARVLVADLEVTTIISFQVIAKVRQLLAIGYGGFPCVQPLPIHLEENLLPIGPLAIRPVIIAEYLGIERQFSQQEIGDRLRHPAIVVSLL